MPVTRLRKILITRESHELDSFKFGFEQKIFCSSRAKSEGENAESCLVGYFVLECFINALAPQCRSDC